MKDFKHFIIAVAVLIAMAFGSVNADVYVFGTVVDTSDDPIAEVSMIISTTGPGGGEVLDTLSSGNDGNFAKNIVYGQDLERVRYTASKAGYQSETGTEDVVQDSADLGTITLATGSTSEIYVFGMVVDTSDNPIAEASIIISTTGPGGEPLDTLSSGNDGKFAQSIVVNENLDRVRYSVSKDGYRTENGMGDVERDTVDLDTITLRPGPTSIDNVVQITIGKAPNKIALYNLRGQMLYIGHDLNLERVLQGKIARSQALIAHYMLDNTVIYRKKVILTQ